MNPASLTASHWHWLDSLVLAAYFAGTLGIGLRFYRRAGSTEGFTTANRSLSGLLCGLSIFATFLSSISYLALPGKSFASDWNPFVFSLTLIPVTWIAVRFFLPYYRSRGDVSAYAALEQRFGLWARLYASVFYLLTQVARAAVVLYLMALPLQMLFGWDIRTVLIVTGAIVTLYAFVGGIVAVIWTDALQAVVLMAGALLCLAILLLRMPGGPQEALTLAASQGKFSLGSLGASLTQPTVWVVLAYGLVINLQNFGIDQNYIQRYIASSSDREARRSIWLGGLLYVPVSAVFFLIGTCLFAYYDAGAAANRSEPPPSTHSIEPVRALVARQRLGREGVATTDPAYAARLAERTRALSLADIGDRVFPYFIAAELPPGVSGLLIAAVFAAAMSTVSTSLNSSATLILSDFYVRLLRPGAGNFESMLVLRGATALWGALGTLLALWLVRQSESALDLWWTLAGVLGGGITGLFLLGFLSRRTGNPAAIAGVIAGGLAILTMSAPRLLENLRKLPPSWAVHRVALWLEPRLDTHLAALHAFLIPVVGTLVILLVGMACTWTRRSIRDGKRTPAPPH